MRSNKFVVGAGLTLSALSLATFLWNFFNMYSLAGKCQENVDVQPCQAYDNWQLANKIAVALLVFGIIILAVGLIKRRRNG